MKLSTLLLAGSLICVSAGWAGAQAATFTERDSTYQITFSDPTNFSTALTQYDVTATMPAGGTNQGVTALGVKSGAFDMYFQGTGGVTTTYVVPASGAVTTSGGDVLNDGDGGTFKFGYKTNNGPDFTSSWTETTIDNGHQVLAFGGIGSQGFGGCGSGLADAGAIFTCEVFIQGKYSLGTSTGDIDITNLDPAYTSSLVYNQDLGASILTVATGNYQGNNPGLGFEILGASTTPEPAAWLSMLLGVGLVGSGLRVARRQGAARLSAI